jgi:hypothetical protein
MARQEKVTLAPNNATNIDAATKVVIPSTVTMAVA